MSLKFNARLISRQAIIATIYLVLTLSGFGFAHGPIQFRFSEVLNWLAFLDPKNIIGLSIGCFLSNIPSPFGMLDMVVGTLGTLLATLCMAKSKTKWVACIWPSFFSFLYAAEALYTGEITKELFPIVTGQIMLSEFIITTIIGIPLVYLLSKETHFRNLIVDDRMLPTRMSWTSKSSFPF